MPCKDQVVLYDPDYTRLSTSSTFYGGEFGVQDCSTGRLSSGTAWCALTNSQDEWWQISSPTAMVVVGAAVKGRGGQHVTKWKFQYWDGDGARWVWVDDEKEFDGTQSQADSNTRVDITFDTPVLTRIIRFRPWAWVLHVSARMALRIKEEGGGYQIPPTYNTSSSPCTPSLGWEWTAEHDVMMPALVSSSIVGNSAALNIQGVPTVSLNVSIYPCNRLGCQSKGIVVSLGRPGPPSEIHVRLLSGSSDFQLFAAAPLDDGGADLTSYRVRVLRTECGAAASTATSENCNTKWKKILQYGDKPYLPTPSRVGDLSLGTKYGLAKMSDDEINEMPPDDQGYYYYKMEQVPLDHLYRNVPPTFPHPPEMKCKGGGQWPRPYGNVATTKEGVESCRDQCHAGGYPYFGLECPMTTQVHCQCASQLSTSTKKNEDICNGGRVVGHCVGPFVIGGYLLGSHSFGSVYSTTPPPNYSPLFVRTRDSFVDRSVSFGWTETGYEVCSNMYDISDCGSSDTAAWKTTTGGALNSFDNTVHGTTTDDCDRWFADAGSKIRCSSPSGVLDSGKNAGRRCFAHGSSCVGKKIQASPPRWHVTVSKLTHTSSSTSVDFTSSVKSLSGFRVSGVAGSGEVSSTFQVESCNKIGCSLEHATFVTRVPGPPEKAVLRSTGRDRLSLRVIKGPVDDGGANVTKYRVYRVGFGGYHDVSVAGGAETEVGGSVEADAIGAALAEFRVHACNQLGCSDEYSEVTFFLPANPSYVQVTNKDGTSNSKLALEVRAPLDDGGGDVVHYITQTTCYLNGGSSESTEENVTSSSGALLEDGVTLSFEIESPSSTTNICRVDVLTCTFIGCGTLSSNSWNIGLNSKIKVESSQVKHDWMGKNSEGVMVLRGGNVTLSISTEAENNKAVPATTDVRVVHYVDATTQLTTLRTFADVSSKGFLMSTLLNRAFSVPIVTWLFESVEAVGEIKYKIQGRHCSDQDLCGDWMDVGETPVFFEPGAAPTLLLTAPAEGGMLRATVQPPIYWGHKNIARGRTYVVDLFLNSRAVASTTLVAPSAVTSSEASSEEETEVVFSDLLSSNVYDMRVVALNGAIRGVESDFAKASPRKNVPGKPPFAPVALEVFAREVVVRFVLPAFNGAFVSSCRIEIGEVGNCGLSNAQYDQSIGGVFKWGPGGFLSTDQPEVQNLRPPEHGSHWSVRILNLLDGVEYVARHQCLNEMGEGSWSIPLNSFKTPLILQERYVDGSSQSEEQCTEQTPSSVCTSLTEAMVATPFENVIFRMQKGTYVQRKSWIEEREEEKEATNEDATEVGGGNNTTNTTAGVKRVNITIFGPGEDYPLIFGRIRSQVVGVSGLPSEVVFSCGGSRCIDLSTGE